MLSHVEIEPSTLIGVGLSFKGDASVRLVPVAQNDKPYQKLQNVQQIEADKGQLLLLLQVDALMPNVSIIQPYSIPHEYHVEDGDGLIATWG